MLAKIRLVLLVVIASLTLAGSAQAAGGEYVFDGGTKKQRAQVRAALNASSFDWDRVPLEVTIHIERGVHPHATVGEIWLDPRLLDSGRFSWGIVQHEYAHQVAFLLVGSKDRTKLVKKLGGKDWCYEKAGLAHDDHACERFAENLAWAYWPTRWNTERPEAGHRTMKPAAFRTLVASIV